MRRSLLAVAVLLPIACGGSIAKENAAESDSGSSVDGGSSLEVGGSAPVSCSATGRELNVYVENLRETPLAATAQ
jgi:hypothetical protein